MSCPSIARLALAGVCAALLVTPAAGREVRAGALRLTGAWSRPTPPGAPAGVGYVTVTNTGTHPDRLLGGSSPDVARVEVHEMDMAGGVMRMRPVTGGLAIPAGGSVALAPGGYHLMLIGPRRPFAAAGGVPVTLRFERAGSVRVAFTVRTTPPETNAAGGAR